MEYKLTYTKESIIELKKAKNWYKSKDIDLSKRFKKAFDKIRTNLKENPKIFKEVENNHRRAVLGSSFPYKVHYLINEKEKTVKIIGLFHQSQNLKLVQEKIKIKKIHELRKEENEKLNKRLNQIQQIRHRKEQERNKGRERDRGLER